MRFCYPTSDVQYDKIIYYVGASLFNQQVFKNGVVQLHYSIDVKG